MKNTMLFVYGAMYRENLRPLFFSAPMHEKTPASLRAKLYRLQSGIHGAVLSQQEAVPILGELLVLSAPDFLLQTLDVFFGYNSQFPQKSLFIRQEVSVSSIEGNTVQAWTYLLSDFALAGAKPVPSGDWARDVKERPALLDTLTPKQRAYVCKLGVRSGREIVPIDMNLYRELLKLELVVDKGRRLALSKLGQEVFQFLRAE